jgi:IclR family KDG regulon transcriptional repressor
MGNINTMVDRAGAILDYLYASNQPVGVSQLAKDLELPKATAFRILKTLLKWNLVENDFNTNDYKLGKVLIKYGGKVSSNINLIKMATPVIDDLANRVGESTNINIEYQNNSLNIYKSSGDDFKLVSRLIPISPLNCSASGKIFLSKKSDDYLKAYFENDQFEKRTIHSITNYKELKDELTKIKQSGLSYDDEEYEYGLFCIAHPIYHHDQLVAAISVSGPKARLKNKGLKQIEEELKSSCKIITDLIQYLDPNDLF